MKKITALLLCLAVFLAAFSGIAAAKKKEAPKDKGTIVFIPHDNRPISDVETADTIRQLGYKVVVPPDELLGSKSNLGDSDKLWQWLEDNTTVPHKKDKKPPYKPLPGISQMLWGNIDLDASNVRDHTTCRLGRWYATKGRELFGSQPEFQKLERDHARFHACCAEAIDAYHGKNKKLVDNLTEELSALSATVIGSLDELKNKL